MRTAEEIAERARGKYKPEYITQTNSVAVPIIERLSSEEQLHFVSFNETNGFRIFESDGEEQTPDHTGARGKRFLLLTDKRILYIVGKAKEAEDKVQEFAYDQITSAEGSNSMGRSPKIEFTTMDGRRYRFVDNSFGSDTVQNKGEYINSRTDPSKQSPEKSAQEKTSSPASDQPSPDMRSAEEMVERARGKYKAEYITQTNSVAVPIIERLSSGEQLHFVFFHENKGFRIFEPDGEERTPDHTGPIGSHGSRFLLITDERILYIIGGAKEAEDKVQEFNYDHITSTESYESKGVWIVEFTTTDGRRYKFAHNHGKLGGDTVPNAAEYINSQMDSKTAEGSEERAQEDTPDPEQVTPDSPGTKFCPDCGAEVGADDTFCTECGTSLDSERKDQTEHFENRSSSGGSTESSTGDGGRIQWWMFRLFVFAGVCAFALFVIEESVLFSVAYAVVITVLFSLRPIMEAVE